MDLFNEIQDLTNKLDISIKSLRKNGQAKASAERDYKMTLCQEALKLRSDGDLPATLINQVVYGLPEVASKRYSRDVAEAMYNANLEFINVTKLKLRILENQLSREWGKNEKYYSGREGMLCVW